MPTGGGEDDWMGQLSIGDFAANANKLQLCQSGQLTNDTRPRGNIKRLTRWGGTEKGVARQDRAEVLATQLNILLTWRHRRCLKGDFVVLAWWCVDCWLLTTSLPPLLPSPSWSASNDMQMHADLRFCHVNAGKSRIGQQKKAPKCF